MAPEPGLSVTWTATPAREFLTAMQALDREDARDHIWNLSDLELIQLQTSMAALAQQALTVRRELLDYLWHHRQLVPVLGAVREGGVSDADRLSALLRSLDSPSSL